MCSNDDPAKVKTEVVAQCILLATAACVQFSALCVSQTFEAYNVIKSNLILFIGCFYLDLFYGKVKFGNIGFSIGKSEKNVVVVCFFQKRLKHVT